MGETFDQAEAETMLSNPDSRSYALLEIYDNAIERRMISCLASILRVHGEDYIEELTDTDAQHIKDFLGDN
jgi:hypothetical protein